MMRARRAGVLAGFSFRRELAIRVLANHLAVLSRMPANSEDVRRVVKVLDELLAESSASAGVGGLQ